MAKIYDNEILKIEYHYNDKFEFHKEHGPAKIFYYPNGKIEKKYWYKNNKLHKKDSPAVIRYDINGKIIEEFYFLNGIEVTKIR